MMLFYDEYVESCKDRKEISFKKYLDCPKYLHEMTNEEFDEIFYSYSITTFENYKTRLQHYLKFLYNKCKDEKLDIDYTNLLNLNVHINEISISDYRSKASNYFYSVQELMSAYEGYLKEIEISDELKKSITDYDPLKACYVLQWYGVHPKHMIDLEYDAVSDDGKTITYNDKSIEVDDESAANFLAEYKHKKSATIMLHGKKSIKPYIDSGKFIRNVYSESLTIKNYSNLVAKFHRLNTDKRFVARTVYLSGRMYKLYEYEQSLHREITVAQDWEAIAYICNITVKNANSVKIYGIFNNFMQYKSQ